MRSDANFGNSPVPFLVAQCKNFIKFWRPKVPEECAHQLYQNLKDVRQYARDFPIDSSEHTPSNYKKAIHDYKKDTPGSDIWTNKTLRNMPDIVISNIADDCKKVVDTVCLPHQSLLSLNSVIGKPGGGLRTISCTPMITSRMINKVSSAVKAWEANISIDCSYDTAKKGCSALDAALARNLLAEVAFWLKQVFGAAFNDYHIVLTL